MKAIRTAAISLMAAFFICPLSYAQEAERQSVPPGMQIDSTVVEEPDGSITVKYFSHEIPVADPWPGIAPELLRDDSSRQPEEGEGPSRLYPSFFPGPKDTSAYVNPIPLSTGMSQTGARLYTVPVPVASDCNFAPSISLTYNSQAGNSEVGFGWRIGGLSAITVRNRIGEYDGFSSHTFYDASDAVYALDGMPLMNKAYLGLSDYSLQTVSGQVLVKVHRNGSGKALYFDAIFPDGRKATYGSTTATAPSAVYPLTHEEDVNGNGISYRYGDDGGFPYVYAIYYGPNEGCCISFTYSVNNAGWPSQAYMAGAGVSRSRLLQSVRSYESAGEICLYALSYIERFGGNLLTRIDCTRDFQKLNPVDFEYADGNSELADFKGYKDWDNYSSFNSGGPYVYSRGKMIADDYDDGLVIYPSGTYYGVTATHGLFGIYKEYGSLYPASQQLLIFPKAWGVSTYISAEDGFQSLTPIDIDGDGRDEVVKANLYGVSGSDTRLRFRVYSYQSEYSSSNYYRYLNISGVMTSGSYTSPAELFIYYGDFTSAGKVQALVINKQTSAIKIYDIQTGTDVYSGTAFNPSGDLVRAMDMDGDGVTELLRMKSSGWEVWGYGRSPSSFSVKASGTDFTSSLFLRLLDFGDINGDGYMDIVTANSQLNKLEYRLFNGRAFSLQTPNASYTTYSSTQYQLIDVNYDGLPDLVTLDSDGRLRAYRNDGGSINISSGYAQRFLSTGSQIIPVNLYANRSACAFLAEVPNQGLLSYHLTDDRSTRRVITGSSDSYGVIRSDRYENLSNSQIYGLFRSASDYSSVTGYSRQTLPVGVVASSGLLLPMQADTVIKATYKYYDAVVNRKGLGFCGFGKVWSSEESSDGTVYSETEYDPTNHGTVTAERSSLNPDCSNSFYSAQLSYSLSSVYNPYRMPLPSQVTTTDHLRGLTTTETSTYDLRDLPTEVTRTSTSGGVSFVETTSNTYNNSETATAYITGRLSASSTTRNTAGGPSSSDWTQRTVYTYPTGKAAPSDVKTYVGESLAYNLVSETAYTYDSYGNVTSEMTAPYGATTFTGSTYAYDSSGRHLVSETDALGLVTTYSNYSIDGHPRTVTDHLGNQTAYTYDIWGNLTSVSQADGSSETWAWAWGGDGLYSVTVSGNAQPTRVTHYDYQGRDIRSDLGRFDGTTQHVVREYSPHGWLMRESLPYKAGSASQWTQRSYDDYGRLLSEQEPSGRTTTWSYSGMTTTKTTEGISSAQTMGPDGNLASVTDLGGTIAYSYRSDGQPSSITAPGNVVTSFTYDNYGRRTSIIDPSAGTRSTSYTNNSNGSSSVTQTNANGSVTTYYDRYGRVTREERSNSFDTDYTYNSYGQLTSIVSDNSTSKTYTYDSKGRIVTATENVPDSKWLQKTFTYSSTTGKPATTAFTSQDGLIATESYTYTAGYHTKTMLNGSTTIWQLTGENALGQPTAATTLSTSRTYSYSAAGLPTGRTSGSVYGETYTLDGTKGNLSNRTRTDQSSGQESFDYDSLNRLIEMGSRDVTYDAKGNITAIDDVGSLSYTDSSHPYRVTGATLDNGLSTPGTQTITYTAFDRPASISEGGVTAAFTYNESSDRVKMAVTDGTDNLLTRYYIGSNYEYDIDENNTVTQRLYLEGDAYSAPVVYVKEGTGSWALYNIARDYQGSIMAIATSGGTAVATYSYDPWGRLRNPANNAIYTPGNEPTLLLGRGYTGHEHLPWFGLINMNARLYDPLVGRFLSADPYVQAPDFTQAFNRYSYALNNPLKYVDGNGEFALTTGTIIALTAIIGGVSNWYMNGHRFDDKTFGYFAVGALSGVASWYGAGWLAGITQATGIWAGTLIGAATGAASSAATSTITTIGNNLVGGNKWDTGLKSAVGSALASGALIGAISGGIKGYASAKEKGANPWTNRIDNTTKEYSADIKTGVNTQPDPTKHCYSYAAEYADSGHGNHIAADFRAAIGNPDGGDFTVLGKVSNKAERIPGRFSANELFNDIDYYGSNIESNIIEAAGIIDNSHWVNVIGFKSYDRVSMFGAHTIQKQLIRIWNPIGGISTYMNANSITNITMFLFK